MKQVLDRDCHLCDIIQEGTSRPYQFVVGQPDKQMSEVLLSDDNLFVTLDVGPIVPGYLLAFPRLHRPSFAAIPAGTTFTSLARVVAKSEAAFIQVYAAGLIAFEHGSSGEHQSRSCCVEHAHLHIVPSSTDIIDPRALGFSRYPNLETALKSAAGQDYLYYRDVAGNHWLDTSGASPPQFFRRRLSETTGNPLWSWTDYVVLADRANTRATLLASRATLSELLKDYKRG